MTALDNLRQHPLWSDQHEWMVRDNLFFRYAKDKIRALELSDQKLNDLTKQEKTFLPLLQAYVDEVDPPLPDEWF